MGSRAHQTLQEPIGSFEARVAHAMERQSRVGDTGDSSLAVNCSNYMNVVEAAEAQAPEECLSPAQQAVEEGRIEEFVLNAQLQKLQAKRARRLAMSPPRLLPVPVVPGSPTELPSSTPLRDQALKQIMMELDTQEDPFEFPQIQPRPSVPPAAESEAGTLSDAALRQIAETELLGTKQKVKGLAGVEKHIAGCYEPQSAKGSAAATELAPNSPLRELAADATPHDRAIADALAMTLKSVVSSSSKTRSNVDLLRAKLQAMSFDR